MNMVHTLWCTPRFFTWYDSLSVSWDTVYWVGKWWRANNFRFPGTSTEPYDIT